MSIEYYFYKKFGTDKLQGVNFTDDYRGGYFLRRRKDWHDGTNRDAIIRLNKLR